MRMSDGHPTFDLSPLAPELVEFLQSLDGSDAQLATLADEHLALWDADDAAQRKKTREEWMMALVQQHGEGATCVLVQTQAGGTVAIAKPQGEEWQVGFIEGGTRLRVSQALELGPAAE